MRCEQFTCFCFALIATLGCGALSDPRDSGEPIAKLSGQLSFEADSHVSALTNPRASFAWALIPKSLKTPAITPFSVYGTTAVKDVAIEPALGTYSVDITNLPPEGAFLTQSILDQLSAESNQPFGSLPGRLADGRLFFYQDLDDNGEVTFVDACATAFQDDVIMSSSTQLLVDVAVWLPDRVGEAIQLREVTVQSGFSAWVDHDQNPETALVPAELEHINAVVTTKPSAFSSLGRPMLFCKELYLDLPDGMGVSATPELARRMGFVDLLKNETCPARKEDLVCSLPLLNLLSGISDLLPPPSAGDNESGDPPRPNMTRSIFPWSARLR